MKMHYELLRTIDEHGRVVLPAEFRRRLHLSRLDAVALSLEGETVKVRRKASTCSLCESKNELKQFHGRWVCKSCCTEAQQFLPNNIILFRSKEN